MEFLLGLVLILIGGALRRAATAPRRIEIHHYHHFHHQPPRGPGEPVAVPEPASNVVPFRRAS